MLKVEHLEDGSPDCPLIRLYGFEIADVAALRGACEALARAEIISVRVDAQPWATPIDGCGFLLRAGRANRAVEWVEGEGAFVMECWAEGWLEVADKLEPFTEGSAGFQWLADGSGVRVLISKDGCW